MVLILFALTILGCIAVEVYFRRKEKQELAELLRLGVANGGLPPWAAKELPAGLFVHSGHTWAKVGPSGDVQVGLDRFAQGILGNVDRFELPAKGTEIRQGEPAFAAVQSGKRIEFVSPVDGVIREVNDRINVDLNEAKREPYEKGWAFEIRPYDLAGNLKKLRIGREASGWLEKEVRNFVEFLNLHRAVAQGVGVTMPDGGVHTEGILETMNGEVLQLAIRKFLR